jgi:hypothetical protein
MNSTLIESGFKLIWNESFRKTGNGNPGTEAECRARRELLTTRQQKAPDAAGALTADFD